MDKKLYIFDMDGTLLDSMPVWKNFDKNYLNSYNITPPENIHEIMAPLTLPECADYFISLGINRDRNYIVSEIVSLVMDEYTYNIPLKPGMYRLVTDLYKKGHAICLLTTSDRSYAMPALKRLNIYQYFDSIFTSTELKLDKRTPEIYKSVCGKYRIPPADTVVYEDTLFAIRSAKAAGCHVVAVYDEESGKDWEEIRHTADETLFVTPRES